MATGSWFAHSLVSKMLKAVTHMRTHASRYSLGMLPHELKAQISNKESNQFLNCSRQWQPKLGNPVHTWTCVYRGLTAGRADILSTLWVVVPRCGRGSPEGPQEQIWSVAMFLMLSLAESDPCPPLASVPITFSHPITIPHSIREPSQPPSST